MKLRCPYDEPREVPSLGRVIEPGEVLDVPRDAVDALRAAGWTEPGRRPAKKTARRRPAKKAAPPTSPAPTPDADSPHLHLVEPPADDPNEKD